MTLGSLFDGSGGFPLAASMCGIEPVWASEKVMPIDGHEEDEGVYDAPCPLLEELGVRYLPDEEKECLGVE